MDKKSIHLPKKFRKMSIRERRDALAALPELRDVDLRTSYVSEEMLDLTDAMIESAIGSVPVPLGLTDEFLIDGSYYRIPMATEEPSVIAAASFAGSMATYNGGFTTWATDPITTVQTFVENPQPNWAENLENGKEELIAEVNRGLRRLVDRGGGVRDLSYSLVPDTDVALLNLDIDVRDAMGANIVNSAAERIRKQVEHIIGGRCLMGILTNDAKERRAGAEMRVPVDTLTRGVKAKIDGAEVARRIALASLIAQKDRSRAVTHNKGIMNGISALGLATGNDIRGIEASAHHYACKNGSYRGLSTFTVKGNDIVGTIELPLPFATVGGAVSIQPVSAMCLKILGNPGGVELSRIAAALGLAQNFAALLALVTDGIQKGHMRLHAERIAFQAGARDNEIKQLADVISADDAIQLEAAQRILGEMRGTSE